MSTNDTINKPQWARFSRLAMLSLTLGGPVVRATLERLRSRAATSAKAATTAAQEQQADIADIRERIKELTQESRERVAQQVQQLRKQARQLQGQSRQLRKAVQLEARQRQKYLKQARKAGVDWGQDVWKRGEQFTGEIIELGGKASHDLVERSQDLSRDLAKRGRKARHELANLSEQALEPVREHSRIWTFVGFGVGLFVAGAVTYRLVRGRAARLQAEEESIEISAFTSSNGATARPAPTLRHFDQDDGRAAVAVQSPAKAVFVGIVSTKRYYPVDAQLDATDLVYFLTEEEARQQGFTTEAE